MWKHFFMWLSEYFNWRTSREVCVIWVCPTGGSLELIIQARAASHGSMFQCMSVYRVSFSICINFHIELWFTLLYLWLLNTLILFVSSLFVFSVIIVSVSACLLLYFLQNSLSMNMPWKHPQLQHQNCLLWPAKPGL